MNEPRYILYWKKTEVGVVVPGSKPFWTGLPGVMAQVKRHVKDLPLIGGKWEFTLLDANGNEVSIA